jgi:hypothetical protein
MLMSVISDILANEDPRILPIPKPRPIWRDCDFWCAEARALAQSLLGSCGVASLVSCDSGLPNCIDEAVLVANDTFISRVEKLGASLGKGDESRRAEEASSLSCGGDDWKGEGDRRLSKR